MVLPYRRLKVRFKERSRALARVIGLINARLVENK
jgi:hypothetical protein